MSDEGKNIDDLIRDGFAADESNFDFGSWDQIADSLDSSNGTVDDLLQSAYPTEPLVVPSEGWEAVNTQLDIDTVWNRIHNKLSNRKRFIYFWRVAGAAALLLALIYVLTPATSRLEPTSRNLIGEFTAEKNKSQDRTVELNSIEDVAASDYGSTSFEENSNTVVQTVENQDLNIQPFEQHLSSSNGFDLSLTDSNNPPTNVDPDEEQNEANLIVEELTLVRKLNPNTVNSITYKKGTHQPLVQLEKIERPKRNHWEVGAGLELQHLFIDDANSTEALSSTSNSQLGFNLNPLWTIQGRYVWNDRHFTELRVAPIYTERHRIFKYEKLTRVERLTEFDMSSASLGYGRLFQIAPNHPSHQLMAQISADATYIWSEHLYRNGVLIDNQLGVNEWNLGVGVTLGYKKTFGQFFIMPSWKSSFGIVDHLKSSSFSSKRLVTHGVSLNIGIKF